MQEQYTQQIFKYFKKCDKHLYSSDKEIFTFHARMYKNVVKAALEPVVGEDLRQYMITGQNQ